VPRPRRDDTIELPVQVNGKLRDLVPMAPGLSEIEIEQPGQNRNASHDERGRRPVSTARTSRPSREGRRAGRSRARTTPSRAHARVRAECAALDEPIPGEHRRQSNLRQNIEVTGHVSQNPATFGPESLYGSLRRQRNGLLATVVMVRGRGLIHGFP